MELLKAIFETAESGDRVLVTLPDLYSFLTISRSIANYSDPFWILWSDAAVERINHLSKKYGFPSNGDAVVVEARKDCIFLNEVEKVRLDELPSIIGDLTYSVIISFGLNFLSMYNLSLSKAIEAIMEHEKGLLFNCVINNDIAKKLMPFHDIHLEVVQNDAVISYHTYTANLKFNVRDGVAVLSDTFSVYE
ncbi:hypothetical protein DRP05_00195 [Archaeoglobales archaeon]|nr:MAG: hypothetical protein DRP05_00195 [Archaeoglobales archaeon]